MQENDFFGLGTTYYQMADFLKKEGKDSGHLRKIGYQMKIKFQSGELRRYEESGVLKRVEILSCDDSCGACKILNHKVFLIKEAKIKNPIPVEQCSHKYGCRCVYLPVVE